MGGDFVAGGRIPMDENGNGNGNGTSVSGAIMSWAIMVLVSQR
jgi:hypothetical protein